MVVDKSEKPSDNRPLLFRNTSSGANPEKRSGQPLLLQRGTVLDVAIACVDDDGRPVFRDLLFRHPQCVFIAFDHDEEETILPVQIL